MSAVEGIGDENGGTSGKVKRWEMKRWKGEDECGGGRGQSKRSNRGVGLVEGGAGEGGTSRQVKRWE